MSSEDDILVLTTREKDWWWSLQEITPAIENVWTAIGRSRQETVRILCVPLPSAIEQDLLASAPWLKRIVITSVTPGTVRTALLLRTRMKAAAPMTIYVQGDATEGFHAFGELANVLTEKDVFVTACHAEAVATRRSFPNAQVCVIPFPLVDQFKVACEKRHARPGPARLAYIGRVSAQKNLHTLLFALWILRTFYDDAPRVGLDVYGGEDNLGSPNMGLESADYGTYLRGLAESLGMADTVTWHGVKPRDWLFYDVHQEPHVLVSPTLHSDENFGSSVLASLVNGNQVVTTAWGGHFGFQEWFSRQLTLVPVHRSTMGPVVHPALLADAILEGVGRAASVVVEDAALDAARAEFSEKTVAAHTVEMLRRPGRDPVPLRKSPTQQLIDERRDLFGGTRKIYADYQDPVAQIFFEAYGMKEPLTFEEGSSYVLVPWASCSDDVLHIDDPHRGRRSISFDATISDPLKVTMCPSMETCRLPEHVVQSLVAEGHAFSVRKE
ncbi:Glycosyltransferase involved in cell wall bisynthesis [Micromonospora echinospora]|uniref:Glycosyltransferase involved in cell wall bisynthesis n=1 Tax=Micromonospora echinospora TaxID=1877 RepID=A0A1C5A4Y3_MICEC|nr:glycosyltransferase [Micromonospora echinospora]SCF40258.1 Glycosyltransferase involved in cell wall bisynthesis [Micromonospora echinospora]